MTDKSKFSFSLDGSELTLTDKYGNKCTLGGNGLGDVQLKLDTREAYPKLTLSKEDLESLIPFLEVLYETRMTPARRDSDLGDFHIRLGDSADRLKSAREIAEKVFRMSDEDVDAHLTEHGLQDLVSPERIEALLAEVRGDRKKAARLVLIWDRDKEDPKKD